MRKKVEDFHEFEAVARLPRGAVTQPLIDGVRCLDERTEMEPLIREILADSNETPHGSTEIADILTCQLSSSGKDFLGAFVNKGKAFPKVRSKDVAHQLMRLSQIPSINMIVLLASGNIMDDAIRDLETVAAAMQAGSLVVDAVDLVRLFIVHGKICPHDAAIFDNNACPRCGHEASKPLQVTFNIFEEPWFEVLKHDDVSHGLARRVSLKAQTDVHYTRPALREVVKKIIWDYRASDFSRSRMVEEHFKDQEADYIDLFLFKDKEDMQQNNWLLKAEWRNPGTREEHLPFRIKSDEALGDIGLQWNSEYAPRKEFLKKYRSTKGQWTKRVETVVEKMAPIMQALIRLWLGLLQGEVSKTDFGQRMEHLEEEARDLSDIAGEAYPPIECEDCDLKLYALTGDCHNAFIPFAKYATNDLSFEQRLVTCQEALRSYSKDLPEFLYELKKVGVDHSRVRRLLHLETESVRAFLNCGL